MHKIAASILLFAFLGQTFDQGFYYLGYLIEKKEYIKRCENKNRPQLQCNGKCQLMKKIKEQQEKEQGQPPELKLAAKAELVSPLLRWQLPAPVLNDKRRTFIHHAIGSPIDRSSSLFHPPNLA
ncbi:MAG: hypothetical protein EOO01_21125 [Chitinophagaceae bacterium]|nr:MAG: hypothetical protein EOO01_21125 [Chitinophagaceae bacterium]